MRFVQNDVGKLSICIYLHLYNMSLLDNSDYIERVFIKVIPWKVFTKNSKAMIFLSLKYTSQI